MREIVLSAGHPSRILQQVSILLKENRTINSILVSVQPPSVFRAREADMPVLMCGAPASYVTSGAAIEVAKKKDAEAAAEIAEGRGQGRAREKTPTKESRRRACEE